MLEKIKAITMDSGTPERGRHWELNLRVRENGSFHTRGTFIFRDRKERYIRYGGKDPNGRNRIRKNDRQWVIQNIPSSIWWYMECHHDWKNGGRMYLLTKGEHTLRHRRDIKDIVKEAEREAEKEIKTIREKQKWHIKK